MATPTAFYVDVRCPTLVEYRTLTSLTIEITSIICGYTCPALRACMKCDSTDWGCNTLQSPIVQAPGPNRTCHKSHAATNDTQLSADMHICGQHSIINQLPRQRCSCKRPLRFIFCCCCCCCSVLQALLLSRNCTRT